MPVAFIELENELFTRTRRIRDAGVGKQDAVPPGQGLEYTVDCECAPMDNIEHRGDALQLGGRVKLALSQFARGVRALGHAGLADQVDRAGKVDQVGRVDRGYMSRRCVWAR